MFFTEFIIFVYSVTLLGFISFFIKEEYAFSLLSLSFNNYSQILLSGLIFSLSFFDNFSFITETNCFSKDCFSLFFQTLLTFSLLYVIFVSRQYVSIRLSYQQEYELLIMISFIGLLLLCFSSNLLIVYLAIELQSLVFYTLSAFQKSSEFSGEAGLKYFILGSFSSGFLLFGFANVYLFTST
jgi:NADH-quinone oxidoreductase subunit N